MAQQRYYGSVKGRGMRPSHQCGTKATGLITIAASTDGALEVNLGYDTERGRDYFTVRQIKWQGKGKNQLVATGWIGEKDADKTG